MPLQFSAPPKALPLLAYLLLNRKRTIKREELAALLWPDEADVQARANLRRHLYHLRHALNPNDDLPQVIITDGAAVQWNDLAATWFDVEHFEELSSSAATLTQAVSTYTGELLDGVYDEWIFPQRERLRLLYIADLNALALESRSRRDFKQALAYVHRVLEADPWREDAIRQSLKLRFEIGDRSGAIAEYLEFAGRLRREMDLEPMPETVAVYESIRHNDPALSPHAGKTATERRAKTPLLPFTGRGEIMATLGAKWTQAAHGHGNTVLISGEAGIGKSRVTAELGLRAESEGARPLAGAATAVESSPYDAVTQALRGALPLFAELKLEAVWRDALGALIPEVRATHPTAVRLPALEPDREQLRLFEAVAQLLFALAKSRPVLLIIEDAHLAGAGTAKLLGYLARRASFAHLLILVTYRAEEASRTHHIRELRRVLEKDELAKHIPLGPLSRDAVTLIAASSNVPELAERLYADSEGNPFFLTEMLRSHSEGSDISVVRSNGIQSLISTRTSKLSAPAHSLVEAASVVGPSFDVELLKEVCEWDESVMLDALDEILDRQLIRESSAGNGDFTFSHHLIHAGIYEGCGADSKKRRHRRVARALLELYPERVGDLAARIAFHLERSGETSEATPYYLRAARSAQALFANLEAVDLAKRGIAACTDPAICDALALLLENLYDRVGDRKAQAEQLTYLEGRATIDGTGVESITLLRRAALHHCLGERAQEAAALRKLDERCSDCPDDAVNADRLMAWAVYDRSVGKEEAAIAAMRQALSLAFVQANPQVKTASLCMLAELYSGVGRYGAAESALHDAQLADAQKDSPLLARVLRAAVKLAMDERDFAAARDAGERLLGLCEPIGDRKGTADAHAGLGAAIGRAFDVSLARKHYHFAAELYRSIGDKQGEAVVLLNTGTLLLLTGDCRGALGVYADARPFFRSLEDVRGQLLCALNSSVCWLYLDDCRHAMEDARAAFRLARRLASRSLEAHALANLGAVERDAGNCEAAIAHMNEGIAMRRTLNESSDLAADLCDLGLAHLKRSDLHGAQGVLDDFAAVGAHDIEQMLFPQYFSWVKSALLDALGRHDEARDAIEAAHAELQGRLSAIPDKRARPMYQSLPFNQNIERAFARIRKA
ncbi:MAG: AAA family ATPase [Candidatus Tumulicola sp.]